MELKKRIEGDLKVAMLGKDTLKVTVLRGIKAAILDMEVAEGKRESGLTDGEIEKILVREVKRRKEAIASYETSGRGDLAESEKFEQEVLEGYLPKQLSDEEIVEKIDEVMASLGEGEVANVGQVIGKVKILVGSSADGAKVARLVKERVG